MFARLLLIGIVLAASLAYVLSGQQASNAQPRPPYIRGRNRTVLFVTNREHGLSNVHVATASALLEGFPDIEVHYASFPGLARKLARVSSFSRKRTPAARDIILHDLRSLPYGEAFMADKRYDGIMAQDRMIVPPASAGIDVFAEDFPLMISPWSVEDHMAVYEEVGALIDDVDPAVVVLDTLFRPAIDATRDKNWSHAFITPNTLVDNFLAEQPYGSMLWKYPALTSGFEFPVPLRKIPENIYLNLRVIHAAFAGAGLSAKKAALRARGLRDPINFMRLHRPDVPWITMDTEGASIPVDVVPANVTRAGPILMDAAPAAVQDPDLVAWLGNAPTVLFNLGSHFVYTEERAAIVAAALARVMERTDNGVQVLWKFNKRGGYPDDFMRPIRPHVDAGRVRVAGWLEADPFSLLETGRVVASVHHGGSNCYHEAIASGVAQVVLPMWIDLYNFAALVETMGVGVWACKGTSPDWTAEALAEDIIRVIGGGKNDDDGGASMREKAKAVGASVRARPRGRDVSAAEIAKLAYISDAAGQQ